MDDNINSLQGKLARVCEQLEQFSSARPTKQDAEALKSELESVLKSLNRDASDDEAR